MRPVSQARRDKPQEGTAQKTLAELAHERVVAVIRTARLDDALWGTEQLLEAGIRAFDVTFSVPGADTVIRRLKEQSPEIVVGAGTVMTPSDADRAMEAGAGFLAAPALDIALVQYAAENGCLMLPGVTTPTEMLNATHAGALGLKFFPAEPAGGARYLHTVLAPLPDLNIIATGGVHENNFIGYLKAGAMAVGLGSSLLDAESLAERSGPKIRQKVAVVMERLIAFREGDTT